MAMASIKEARIDQGQFRRKINAILRGLDKNESERLRDALRYLKETRREIIDNLLRSEGFEEIHLQRMINEVNVSLREFELKFQRSLLGGVRSAYEGGIELIRAPLIGSGIKEVPLFVDEGLLRFSLQYSAEQVQGLTQVTRRRLDNILRQGLIGQRTPYEMMVDVRRELGNKTAYEAERIVRTEVNRALNLTEQRYTKQIKEEIPGLRKYWLHEDDARVRPSHAAVGRRTNPDYGGTPIDVEKQFSVGGYKADGPHDVSLPPEESINCRCVQILVTGA